MTYWIDRGKNVLPNWTVAEGDDEMLEELRALEPDDPCEVFFVDEKTEDLEPLMKKVDGRWIYRTPDALNKWANLLT